MMEVKVFDTEGVILSLSGVTVILTWAEWNRLQEMVSQCESKMIMGLVE